MLGWTWETSGDQVYKPFGYPGEERRPQYIIYQPHLSHFGRCANYTGWVLCIFCLDLHRNSHGSVETPTVLCGRQEANSSYDFVIIRGGTSGLTVAGRLTEDGKC